MEVRKGEGKRRKGSERGGISLPLVLRSKDIPKIENFPKLGISKQHSRDCQYSTIVLSQNTQLGLAEYELLRNSYAIP